MKERILRFLQLENKTSSQFAEEIGVQPSSISHIISGRNNPSLDFIIKMLGKYSNINPDWLLFGNGEMYRDNMSANNVSTSEVPAGDSAPAEPGLFDLPGQIVEDNRKTDDETRNEKVERIPAGNRRRSPKRIILLYDDNTFEEYDPS
jgi:transcriptional regulator with XRE-family HTH domain